MLRRCAPFRGGDVENRRVAGSDRAGGSVSQSCWRRARLVVKNHIRGDSYTVIKFMRSYVQIDSISIDLSNCIDKSSDPGKCEHFSMREYVSEIRKKDWKLCWPFPLEDSDSESEPSLSPPPSDVPKCCPLEIASEGSHKNDKTDLNCCSARCRSNRSCSNAALRSDTHQQVPIPVTFEGKEIDLNNSTNLSTGNDHIVVNNEQEKKAEVADSGKNHETGVDDLNHQITSVSSPEVYGGMRQEGKTNEKGLEGKEVSDVELDTSNLKCLDKSSADICNGGTPIAADDQYKEETEEACTVMGVGPIVSEADNISDHTIGLPPPESVACHNTEPGGTDNLAKNEFQDHHLGKSTGLTRKRPRKMRLLTDLLSGNGETKTEQITMQGSPSEGTSIPQDKVDVQGNLTKTGQSRKRKFIVDEELMSETELPENLKENTEAIETVLNNGSSNVFVGIGIPDAVESDWCKPEIESSHTVGKKKNKKIQSVDNHLISEPQKGQQKQNQDYMDFANGSYASKITSRLAPAFTEKGMSNFPLRVPGTENESKFSKGKEKMLQVDEELSSLCCRKNGMLVEDLFAHKRAKIMPNITATVPIHSAKGALNEKELEEGLQLSLNSYLATQAYNKKHIPQAENQLPFSLPFQEGTSRAHQFIRKDREKYVAGEPFIPFKRTTNDISGKRIIREEITGARDTERAAEVLDQVRIFRRYGYQNDQQGTEDDVPMDIVELMAKIQYERGLPDKENGSRRKKSTIKKKAQMTVGNTVNGKGAWGLLQEDHQEEKPEGRYGKNGMVMRGEDVSSHKRNSVRCFSPFDGPQLNANSLSQTQSLFGIEVSQPQIKHSSGFQFSPAGSGQLGSCPNHKLNGRVPQLGSSEATLQAHGGCSLNETILQQDDKASRIWGSLTSNHVSLGYDIFRNKVASQSTSTKDIQKQNMKRDIDLNYINFNASDPEKLNRKRASGSLSRINSEYPFPCKHSGGIEPHQNLRGSQQLYSNETIPAMHLLNLMDAGKQSGTPFNASVNAQMLKGPSYLWDSNDNLEIGTSKAPLGPLKRPSSDHYSKSYLSEKSHGCFLGYPTFGASSSVRLDEEFAGATGLNGQTSFKSGMKDKMKSSNSAMHNGGNTKQFIWPGLEKKTSLQRQLEVNDTSGTLMPVKNISGSNTCSINRNPADFTMPETRNLYMIKGEDLKFEKASILGKRPDLPALHSCRQQKKLKPSKLRELGRH